MFKDIERKREYQRKWCKEKRIKAQAAGICKCGRKIDRNGAICKICLEARVEQGRLYTRVLKKHRLENGECIQCGVKLHEDMDAGSKECLNCRERKHKAEVIGGTFKGIFAEQPQTPVCR